MATKKTTPPLNAATGKASTAVAVKKASGTSLVSVKEAMQAQIANLANRTAPPTGIKIRATQDKNFILPDGTKTPGPLELVIVDFVATNEFYEGAYDKDSIVPPGCFAVGEDPKKMVPSSNAPNKQSTDCQSCPMNQFGSNGKGKACKNGRLLAVLTPDATADTPFALLAPSATALKGFDAYVTGVARTFQTMPVGVVTTVGFDENETYAKMVFSDPRPNPELGVHFVRQSEARELLMAERDVSGYVPINKTPAKKAPARR